MQETSTQQIPEAAPLFYVSLATNPAEQTTKKRGTKSEELPTRH